MTATTAPESAGSGEPILFFHLPKTAGTALRNLFARQLGETRVTRSLAMMPLADALVRYADFDAICGHFHAEQGRPFPTHRVSMTVLREPVDRFLSYFYFRKFDVQNGSIDPRVHSLELEEFIEQLGEENLDELNLQTTMLYPLGAESMRFLPWRERVASARRALDRFDYVGIHGEIEDFVCMISARMGWPADVSLDRVNVTSRRNAPEHLSPGARRKLDEVLQYDHVVFEHALARFRQLRRAAILGSAARQIWRQPSPGSAASVDARPASIIPGPQAREFGDRRLELMNVWATGEMSGHALALIGEQLTIHIEFVAHDALENVSAGFLIRDERGLPVFGINSWLLGHTCRVTPGVYRLSFSFVNRIERGEYIIDAHLIRNGSHFEGCHHWKEGVARFDVHELATPYFAGRVLMDARAELSQVSAQGSIEMVPAAVKPARLAPTTGRLNPPLADFSARIALLHTLPALEAGTELLVDIELANTGSEVWCSGGKRPVCLSYHWHDAAENVLEYDGLRTRLPRDIEAGDRIRLVGLLRMPQKTGALRLIWTLVQEEVAWFDQRNSEAMCRVDVFVT